MGIIKTMIRYTKSLIVSVLLVIITTFAAVSFHDRSAASEAPYSCQVLADIPSTVVNITDESGQHRTKTMIRWTSNEFKKAGYPPLTRCKEVTSKFNKIAREYPKYKFLTNDRQDSIPIIGVTDIEGGRSKEMLFTLKRDDPRGKTAIKQIIKLVGSDYAGGNALDQQSCSAYLDLTTLGQTKPISNVVCPSRKR
jgi:Circadian oscillating protein COP23